MLNNTLKVLGIIILLGIILAMAIQGYLAYSLFFGNYS